MQPVEYRRDNFLISTDKSRLDIGVIHGFLTESYWAKGVPVSVVQKSIENSLCFGIYDTPPGTQQIGFARAITDCATFAYLADVFILEPYRGKGLSKWLMSCILAHPELQGLRRWMLATRDAHGLYRQFGFEAVEGSTRLMSLTYPDVYEHTANG
jgi:GNAT superfamily N-acetyltransferase